MAFDSSKLGKEKILKLIVSLSIPATMAMIINALYNLVDAIFIGRGVGRNALGGIAVAFPVQLIVMGFGFLIGIGSASVISRSLGSKNEERAKRTVGNAYLLGIIVSAVVVTIFAVFLDDLIMFFGATEDLFGYTKDYLEVILIGSTFFILAIITNNIIRSEGNAKMAMLTMAFGALLNIALDPIFIFVFKMGIKGAAYATIISQFLNFSIGLIYLVFSKTELKLKLKDIKFDLHISREVFAVGVSAFVRQIAGSIVMIVLNNVIKEYAGELATLYISSFGIINRITAFMLMPLFGVVQAFMPIVGYNFGAKQLKRVLEAVKTTIIIMITIGSLASLFAQLFPSFLVSLFIEDEETIYTGVNILRYAIFFVPLVGIQIITATLFQAIGKAKQALFLALLRQLILLIPLLLIMPRISGVKGIWLAFPLADGFAIVISFILLVFEMNVIRKKELSYVS